MSETTKPGGTAETRRLVLLIQAVVILKTLLEEAANNPAVWNVGDWESLLGGAEMVRNLAEEERRIVRL